MGVQKLLLPLAGKTVIEHIIDQVAGATSVSHIVVVTGADGREVSAALNGRRVVVVRNPESESEMLESVRCGLAALPGDCGAILIVLGDQPAIQTEWIEKLAGVFRENGGEKIVVPVHDGHRGHPMIIPARFARELRTQYEESGIRGLLDAHAEDVVRVQWGDGDVLADMDLPSDYRRELQRFGGAQ
jgi:CTP:molybdopterin cytidylyltransferase MocA